jgi:hypothetical protein
MNQIGLYMYDSIRLDFEWSIVQVRMLDSTRTAEICSYIGTVKVCM